MGYMAVWQSIKDGYKAIDTGLGGILPGGQDISQGYLARGYNALDNNFITRGYLPNIGSAGITPNDYKAAQLISPNLMSDTYLNQNSSTYFQDDTQRDAFNINDSELKALNEAQALEYDADGNVVSGSEDIAGNIRNYLNSEEGQLITPDARENLMEIHDEMVIASSQPGELTIGGEGIKLDGNKYLTMEEEAFRKDAQLNPSNYSLDELSMMGLDAEGNPIETWNQKFDGGTDAVTETVQTVLSPINFAFDKVGDGFEFIGGVLPQGNVRDGLISFGRGIDNVGNFLTVDAPSRIINYPDNFVDMGTGIYRGITGTPTPVGQPGALELFTQGATGAIADPFALAFEGIKAPLGLTGSLMKMAGTDFQTTLSGGGGGGGARSGGGGYSAQGFNNRLGNKKGLNKSGISGKGAGTGNNDVRNANTRRSRSADASPAKQDGMDLNTEEGRNKFAEEFGELALQNRLRELGMVNVGGFDASESAFAKSDADSSDIKKSLSESQGGASRTTPKTGVTLAPSEQSILEKMFGANLKPEPMATNVQEISRPSDSTYEESDEDTFETDEESEEKD